MYASDNNESSCLRSLGLLASSLFCSLRLIPFHGECINSGISKTYSFPL